MKLSRFWAMPNSDTLSIKPIREFALRYINASKKSVDPFARKCRRASVTNDLNKEMACDYALMAEEFLKLEACKNSDLVIFDPPYSLRQVKECYDKYGSGFTQKDSQNAIRWTIERDIIASFQKTGDTVLSFGWTSSCMGKKRGYEIEEILLVSHGSAHNDTICVAENKIALF